MKAFDTENIDGIKVQMWRSFLDRPRSIKISKH